MSPRLPNTWVSASLGQLGTWLGGGTPSKANPAYWQHGTIHWVSPKDMKRFFIDSAQDQITKKAVKESATNLVPARSVLMVTRSGILAHSFPVAINTVDVAINQDLKAWRSLGVVEPTYAAYFLKARARNILQGCSKDGTTVSSIDFDRLSAYSVAVAPASEQRRIISKIDELFSRIDEGEQALQRVEKLVERYRQSVLKAAVTGELTLDWRAARKRAGEPMESGEALLARILNARRAAWEAAELKKLKAKGKTPNDDRWKQKYQEPTRPDTSDLPELPEGWVWASMDQVGFVSGGLTKNQRRQTLTAQRPYLRVANVYANRLDLDDVQRIGVDDGELDRVLLEKGDLLVVEGNGSIDQIGRVAVWDGSIAGCVHQNHLIKVRCTELLPSWYALIWCLSPLGRDYIRRVASSTAGLHTLSISKVASLPVPVPTSGELDLIRDRFDQAVALVANERQSLWQSRTTSTALRQSILKAAFSGQLVPQDPHDEPASKLLERIAAERAAAPALRQRKKKSA